MVIPVVDTAIRSGGSLPAKRPFSSCSPTAKPTKRLRHNWGIAVRGTVRFHVGNASRKMGASSRVQHCSKDRPPGVPGTKYSVDRTAGLSPR